MNDNGLPTYFLYWGKKHKDDQPTGFPYHRLPYHSLDVAAVGALLLDDDKPLTQEIARFLEITPSELTSLFVFFLTLHDLGKFASAFQNLYEHNEKGLLPPLRCKSYDGKHFRHDRLGWYFWNDIEHEIILPKLNINHLDQETVSNIEASLSTFANVVLGHHGKPIDLQKVKSLKHYTDKSHHNRDAAVDYCTSVMAFMKPRFPIEKMQSKEWVDRLKQISWPLAGLAVTADWVGSDTQFFQYQADPISLEHYWSLAQQRAKQALDRIELGKPVQVSDFVSIKEHFGFNPTPLQHWAETIKLDDAPQLFILEDITGSGKTEAALALTHRLMEKGAADGFYFGLPTMATSNAMFSRVAKHYLHMLSPEQGKPSIVLAHGGRDMNDHFQEAVLHSKAPHSQYSPSDSTATAQCNQWFADSRKKALLAPVGVGTIDQALLAVLPRRHQSLRLLGLSRKVLIFDEVHAADDFMFELLEGLLKFHVLQGGSAILLRACSQSPQQER